MKIDEARVYEAKGQQKAKVLLVDNYDSFTYNLVHSFCSLGAQVTVVLNSFPFLDKLLTANYTHWVISPGPGHPQNKQDFGICKDLIMNRPTSQPLLGVCLGFQGIAAHYGAEVIKAPTVMHGKISLLRHHQKDLFNDLPQDLQVMRYHSLCVDHTTLPADFLTTAWSQDDQVLMAFRHREAPIFGVQFHPESVGTPSGVILLNNFLEETLIGSQLD